MSAARSIFISTCILLSLIALIFSILALVSGLNTAILRNWYYLRINTSQLVPTSESPFAGIINAVAGQLGLYGYYSSGLWNYAAGQATSSTDFGPVSYVGPSSAGYWFDPVSIVEQDLPSIVSFSVPQSVLDDLGVVKTAHLWSKGLLTVGCVFNFLSMLVCTLGYTSRIGSLFATLVAFIAALFTVVAAVLIQILGVILKRTINDLSTVGLVANLGTHFYVFVWISAGAALISFLLVFMTVCCCRPRDRKGYA